MTRIQGAVRRGPGETRQKEGLAWPEMPTVEIRELLCKGVHSEVTSGDTKAHRLCTQSNLGHIHTNREKKNEKVDRHQEDEGDLLQDAAGLPVPDINVCMNVN